MQVYQLMQFTKKNEKNISTKLEWEHKVGLVTLNKPKTILQIFIVQNVVQQREELIKIRIVMNINYE